MNFNIVFKESNTLNGDLNQYKIVLPLCGAACAAPNKGTAILYSFLILISPFSQSSVSVRI